MRQQFHRCRSLRLVEVDASELGRVRGSGRLVLEELCEAKQLARCIGLAECDVLTAGQKRELLLTRATRIRREEGESPLAGAPDPRAAELAGLRRDLLHDRDVIVAANAELTAEIRELLESGEGREQPGFESQLRFREALDRLMVRRLDAIDRALDALRAGRHKCDSCGAPIDVDRLRTVLDTNVCRSCAKSASGPRDGESDGKPARR
jgi:RNA polymerase-binding transcription factor DksA